MSSCCLASENGGNISDKGFLQETYCGAHGRKNLSVYTSEGGKGTLTTMEGDTEASVEHFRLSLRPVSGYTWIFYALLGSTDNANTQA